ncbi:hypothetical protein QQF64_002620 [Cirrhinus molitorella]|uniref:Reverse transcriptase domain-containing protein n=1 Tax=Cirrhinus molitorella TaxID=172907 RepID=A0ABR3MQQ5_9TELE
MAARMTNYLLANKYSDTSCQKAGVPGFPGCVEHSAMIWDQIQTAKRNKSDLHVMWLDLENAYGSVPHQLIRFALNFFHIPSGIQSIITNYFNNLQVCYSTSEFTTGWHQVEKGIAMGCSISPILFTTAFEVILIGGRQTVRGVKSMSGQRLPALRSYMDDVTILLQTAACTNRLLKRLEELLSWARMKIKPSKSRCLSIRKGVRKDNIFFSVNGEVIPRLVDQPVKSLGRLYTAELTDKHMAASVNAQLTGGLKKIDETLLPGKFKLWCYQFTLWHRLLWPLKLCEITPTTVQKMDRKANNYIRKWLGLPRCQSSSALFGRNKLRLPMKTINLGYKQEKVRLLLKLENSPDPVIRDAKVQVRTGRKWEVTQAVQQAITRLKHQEVVGFTQHGRAGLGWTTSTKVWSKATKLERKRMIIKEVKQEEEESYRVKAISQSQQGKWTTWEAVIDRTITWADLWKLPQTRLSFLVRATYDTLPSPQNLHRWYGKEEPCQLCGHQSPSLQHILSSCKTALTQSRYGWRHDRVLTKLAEVIEARRLEVNKATTITSDRPVRFVKQGGEALSSSVRERSLLSSGSEWNLRTDLGRQLKFPQQIAITSLRPDMIPAILKDDESVGEIVLHVGVNDIRLRQTEVLKRDFSSLIETVRSKTPTTRIIVSGTLPT